jgi:hypothetical protein
VLCRVTLTYNLHTEPAGSAGSLLLQSVDAVNKTAFGRQLQSALKEPAWCPKGATIGFALDHKYPTGEGGGAGVFCATMAH